LLLVSCYQFLYVFKVMSDFKLGTFTLSQNLRQKSFLSFIFFNSQLYKWQHVILSRDISSTDILSTTNCRKRIVQNKSNLLQNIIL